MPIYEYRCQNCRRRFSKFWRSMRDAEEATADVPSCPHCGSGHVQRLISRVRLLRSEESHMEAIADPDKWGDMDENDPKSMGRFMRKMMNEMGDEVGDLGPEFNEVVDRLEAGQDPEQIEKEVPGLTEETGTDAGSGESPDFDI